MHVIRVTLSGSREADQLAEGLLTTGMLNSVTYHASSGVCLRDLEKLRSHSVGTT